MTRWQFYFEHSLIGYFSRRAREKWFTPPYVPPKELDYHGVKLQLDCLPPGMQQLILDGKYETSELDLLSKMLVPTDNVLEIGGAIGFIGLYCHKVLNVKNVVSVEPNPQTLSYFKRNYELNGMTPAIIEAAVAQTDGPITFFANDMFWGDSLIQPSQGAGSTTTITVAGLSFNSLLQRAGTTFNVLIVDIEGAEQYLPVQEIPASIKKVMLEIHPHVIGTRGAYGVLETLIRNGFQVAGNVKDCWALVRA